VKTRFSYLILSAVIFLTDQLTKHLATGLKGHPGVPIPGFDSVWLTLVYVENAGIAWGLFADAGHGGRMILSVISLLAAAGIAVYALRTPINEKMTHLGLAFVLGGVLGNLTDRILRGYVIDFLDFTVANYKWPTFNIADTVISLGALILIGDALRPSPEASKEQRAEG